MFTQRGALVLVALSLGGLLFSGYMSAVKLFSQTCAFNEPCPYFFGIPACYIGFIIFLDLFVTAGIYFAKRTVVLLTVVRMSAGIGVLFSGYYAYLELPLFIKGGFDAYTFGVPTCMLGFVFFVLIFVVSVLHSPRDVLH